MYIQPRRIYIFRHDNNRPAITLIKCTYPRRTAHRVHTLTTSTYNRFIRLANSGNYRLMIQEGTTTTWELWATP